MSQAEVKNYLHKMIVEIEDSSILDNLVKYTNSLLEKKGNWWDDLTDEQRTMMFVALEEAKKGETFTREQVREEVDNLLKNKQ